MAGVVEGEVEDAPGCAPTLSGWVRRLVVVMCLFPLALLAQKLRRYKLCSTGYKCIFMHEGGCCQAKKSFNVY